MMKIGIAQIRIYCNRTRNLTNLIAHLNTAERKKINILCFPECTLLNYAQILARGIKPKQDASYLKNTLDTIHELAINKKINIIIGTPYFVHNKVYNTAAILLTNGKRLMYHKNNLTLSEQKYFAPGKKILIFKVADIRCGILICRDQNYPQLARRYKNAGAQVIFILAAHYYSPAEAKLKIAKNRALPIARAIENNLYVFKANTVGKQNSYVSLGGSIIVNPQGYVLAEANHTKETILSYNISKGGN